jgi:hypothetical protein
MTVILVNEGCETRDCSSRNYPQFLIERKNGGLPTSGNTPNITEAALNLVERTFELRGTGGLGAKPRPELIGPVLGKVHETLLASVRMGFMHSSRTRGRIPKGLQRAADVHFIGHKEGSEGSTILRFEVPQFGYVAQELFAQGQLWDTGPKPEQTAFDLLSASLHDIRAKAADSERFDHAMLHQFASYGRLLRHGLKSISLPDPHTPEPEAIDEPQSIAANELYRATPPARRVRICGRLDLMGVSKQVLGLVLEDGSPVTAVWALDGIVDLASLLDRQVVIEGLAEFRPSGSLLRVDADAIRAAVAGDAAFSALPMPEVQRNYLQAAAALRPGHKPYAAIFGLIPADESDEEFTAAVEAMS